MSPQHNRSIRIFVSPDLAHTNQRSDPTNEPNGTVQTPHDRKMIKSKLACHYAPLPSKTTSFYAAKDSKI
ncbi:predicted protein [Sclerotinia sclerotiorum 1980 UF-70]|uniref:Uncharacterized protein n=2 Tax=Sclerotinia sclerotiorum (strain ATCC 18683 / 1980 / Ss-1) TaxID=665079 RepID=A7EIF3_SCLS1|nr:predicted protein [Sclerotinia sclerotiorum 1980 UF-70]APA11641.1 hypothetical protein sscle_08g064110 [Sclerotinia sclerotiorum 1980 UF-70]EDO02619.1 predicted protein [Sclerotinia sclerotiorum 1980 UF-70]